jgi:hypothetical protein
MSPHPLRDESARRTETPSFQRASYQPNKYGNRWAPVLIAWVTTAENPDFATNIEGESGSAGMVRINGPKTYVTGMVELDSVKLTNMLQSPGGNQLMYPKSGHGISDFAAGDLTGAAMLGRGACAPGL